MARRKRVLGALIIVLYATTCLTFVLLPMLPLAIEVMSDGATPFEAVLTLLPLMAPTTVAYTYAFDWLLALGILLLSGDTQT